MEIYNETQDFKCFINKIVNCTISSIQAQFYITKLVQ